jgi:hypothetical protein
VIAVDTNILVYAHRPDSEWHERAASRIRALAEGDESWLIPWPCLHEFLSVVTHPRIFSPPTPLDIALGQVDRWLESPALVTHGESPLHWTTLRRVALASRVTGPVFHDARVASICLDHGATVIWTADRDFSRFPSLRAENPLMAG